MILNMNEDMSSCIHVFMNVPSVMSSKSTNISYEFPIPFDEGFRVGWAAPF